MESNGKHRRALVIGGSMGGLMAARALADHYQEVTILERDTFPPFGDNRRGVPQGRHTHGLLAGGRRVLDRFFPGISDELRLRGAVPGDMTANCKWIFEGACHARFVSGLEGFLMSRPFVEAVVRENVLRLPNVHVMQNTTVEELVMSGGKVAGVKVEGETLAADLVVDATGRGSKSPEWLEKMGYSKPVEERVEIALSYTTRMFRRRPEHAGGDTGVILSPTPDGKRGGVMLAQEGDRWTVTLVSHFGPSAPGDLPGFIQFASTLPAPYIHEVVRQAEPLGEPFISKFPASVRQRYEKLDRFPDGYLVFGDAISSFNPIYGQGMTVACLEAEELAATLSEGRHDLARRFFARAGKVVDIPWSIAVGNDLRMPETGGPKNVGVKLINWYMTKLHRAAHHDPVASLAFQHVANLLAPPPSVLAPRIAARVLWGNLRYRTAAARVEQPMRATAGA